MSVSFEDFWNKLVDHEIWYDQMKMRFFRKDLKGVANDCFIFLLASKQRWDAQDYQDFRKCYQSFLMKSKDMEQKPILQQVEQKTEEPEAEIVTGEKRKQYIDQWLELVKTGPALQSNAVKLTYKEIADEGDWLPKKPAPYPSCSESEVKKRLLHLEYIKQNYDPRTQDPLSTWMSEEEWMEILTNQDIEKILKANIKI